MPSTIASANAFLYAASRHATDATVRSFSMKFESDSQKTLSRHVMTLHGLRGYTRIFCTIQPPSKTKSGAYGNVPSTSSRKVAFPAALSLTGPFR
jgi:hypothetical protein